MGEKNSKQVRVDDDFSDVRSRIFTLDRDDVSLSKKIVTEINCIKIIIFWTTQSCFYKCHEI